MGELNMEQNKTIPSKMIYGKQFWGKSVSLRKIDDETESIIAEGRVFNYERRDIRNNTALITFGITDYTDSIKVKLFVEQKQVSDLRKDIKDGAFLRIKGSVQSDVRRIMNENTNKLHSG